MDFTWDNSDHLLHLQHGASAETREARLGSQFADSSSGVETLVQDFRELNFLGTLLWAKLNKLSLLPNFVSPKIYEVISECTTYEDTIRILQSQYVKSTNEVFACHRFLHIII